MGLDKFKWFMIGWTASMVLSSILLVWTAAQGCS
jgi:hypothetical protein